LTEIKFGPPSGGLIVVNFESRPSRRLTLMLLAAASLSPISSG